MSFYSIVDFIKEHYPQYYGVESYPVDECVTIHKVKEEWGIFCNFAPTPIVIDGVTFRSTEQLFQLMKFQDAEAIINVYSAHNPKMTAKKWEKTHRRSDWGEMVIDAMKFCLVKKYEQSEAFREKLKASAGKYIVEDQSTFSKKQPDAWGVKRHDDLFVGPNLLGRLLMELRDTKILHYTLPNNAFDFIDVLKTHLKV